MPQVIGLNLRRIRGENGWTQDMVASACRRVGLRGTATRVAQIEAGDFAPTIPNLVRLAAALDSLSGRSVAIPDLLRSPWPIQLSDNPAETISADDLSALLAGRPAAAAGPKLLAVPDTPRKPPSPLPPQASFGRADERVARQLGLRKREMQELTLAVWGRGLQAERDDRAAALARRGRRVALRLVTAQLRGELEAELEQRRAAAAESG